MKRYDIGVTEELDGGEMYEAPDGDWVHYVDAEKLLDAVEAFDHRDYNDVHDLAVTLMSVAHQRRIRHLEADAKLRKQVNQNLTLRCQEYRDALGEMVNTHCLRDDGVLDSAGLAANADAMLRLEKSGDLKIKSRRGRCVEGRWE